VANSDRVAIATSTFYKPGTEEGVRGRLARDFVSPSDILVNIGNPKRLDEMCYSAFRKLDPQSLRKVRVGMDFTLEWYDMFHYPESSRSLVGENINYNRRAKEFLSTL